LIFNEKALGDPLVHHYDRDVGFLGHLVVEQIDRSLKLRNLWSEDLIALGITDTISVDDDISREFTLVMLRERLDSQTDWLLHVVLDNLLSLFLDQIVTVVLAHLFVNRGWEADNWLGTCVTHIYADQHGSLLLDSLREL
jgi:hypothetical protein